MPAGIAETIASQISYLFFFFNTGPYVDLFILK